MEWICGRMEVWGILGGVRGEETVVRTYCVREDRKKGRNSSALRVTVLRALPPLVPGSWWTIHALIQGTPPLSVSCFSHRENAFSPSLTVSRVLTVLTLFKRSPESTGPLRLNAVSWMWDPVKNIKKLLKILKNKFHAYSTQWYRMDSPISGWSRGVARKCQNAAGKMWTPEAPCWHVGLRMDSHRLQRSSVPPLPNLCDLQQTHVVPLSSWPRQLLLVGALWSGLFSIPGSLLQCRLHLHSFRQQLFKASSLWPCHKLFPHSSGIYLVYSSTLFQIPAWASFKGLQTACSSRHRYSPTCWEAERRTSPWGIGATYSGHSLLPQKPVEASSWTLPGPLLLGASEFPQADPQDQPPHLNM